MKTAIEKTLVVGPFQCNCRLYVCPKTGDAVLVDPGDDAEAILSLLNDMQTQIGQPLHLKYLFHTHAHLDHIGATRTIRERIAGSDLATNLPLIALHGDDEPLYNNLKLQGELFGLTYEDPLKVDIYLSDEEVIPVGNLKFSILHTPGHSPGSVSIRLHEDSSLGVKESVLSGDTLFRGSVGRTDLWGADQEKMFRSIRQRLLTLDDDTVVCPGHGSNSLIGIEKRSNPFLI